MISRVPQATAISLLLIHLHVYEWYLKVFHKWMTKMAQNYVKLDIFYYKEKYNVLKK